MFDSEPPTSAPPPPDESIRPLSYMGAALWVMGIHIAFLWVVAAVVALRESASRDLIAQLVCQIVAYCLGLFFMLRVHGPHTPIRRFIAFRRTHPALVGLSALLGAAVAVPAAALLAIIEKRWPPEDTEFEFVDLFFQVGRTEQLLIAVGVVIVGPFVEELVFRGALFAPLRQDKPPRAVVLATAGLFALVHLDPRRMLPIFLVGLLLGYVRWASGSLLAPAALHAAFNSIPFIDLLGRREMPPADEETMVPPALLFGSVAACAVLIALVHLLAKHSPSAQAARAEE